MQKNNVKIIADGDFSIKMWTNCLKVYYELFECGVGDLSRVVLPGE